MAEDFEYKLLQFVLGADHYLPLSETEFKETQEAVNGLISLTSLEEKFDILAENFLEFENELLLIAARHRMSPWGIEFRDDWSLINRRFANILTASRMYINQAKHELYPHTQPSAIDDIFSRQYNTHLGYRVMEALRNYAQHRALPVNEVSYGMRWIGDKLAFWTEPKISTEELTQQGGFKKAVL